MRYLIITTTTTKPFPPFRTKYFEPENHFNANLGMQVYDLALNKFSIDGKKWLEIEFDHL